MNDMWFLHEQGAVELLQKHHLCTAVLPTPPLCMIRLAWWLSIQCCKMYHSGSEFLNIFCICTAAKRSSLFSYKRMMCEIIMLLEDHSIYGRILVGGRESTVTLSRFSIQGIHAANVNCNRKAVCGGSSQRANPQNKLCDNWKKI